MSPDWHPVEAVQAPRPADRLSISSRRRSAPPLGRPDRPRLLDRPLKRLLPRSLLGRSLLIILVPLLATEGVALQLFYGSHLSIVSRRLSAAVAGELVETIDLLERFPEISDRAWIVAHARADLGLELSYLPRAQLHFGHRTNILGPMDDDLAAALKETVRRPFTMDWTSDPHEVLLRIQLDDGLLAVIAPRKRLDTGTIFFFLAWIGGTSILLFVIAALFMRNQVRAIRRLSKAAEAFGMGREAGPIKPEGAQEVRRAASAFNRMQERILRFVGQRTEMLAGVSHDLRTPLTRLRLALAVMPSDAQAAADVPGMIDDIQEMERMVDGYLAFARGEGAEVMRPTDLTALIEEVVAASRRAGAAIALAPGPAVSMTLRPDAIRRAVMNLADNARRHARHVELALQLQARQVLILVDDDGPGVAPDRRESVFRPFETGPHGGTGLGLTIARDIVRAHGGDIALETGPLGGLRARVRLPL